MLSHRYAEILEHYSPISILDSQLMFLKLSIPICVITTDDFEQCLYIQQVITNPGALRISNFILFEIVTLQLTALVKNKHLPHSPFSCFEHKTWKIYLKSAFPSDYMRGGAQEQTCGQRLSRAVVGDRQSTRAVWFTREGPRSTAIPEMSPEAFLRANF